MSVSFSKEIFATICERLAEGESLRTICSGEDMPSKSSVFRWLQDDPDLQDQYARAREYQADSIVDEILDIADDGANDWMEREDGSTEYNGDHVQRSRVRIDARKWMAGKLRPKKYGDKIDLTSDGEKLSINVTLGGGE